MYRKHGGGGRGWVPIQGLATTRPLGGSLRVSGPSARMTGFWVLERVAGGDPLADDMYSPTRSHRVQCRETHLSQGRPPQPVVVNGGGVVGLRSGCGPSHPSQRHGGVTPRLSPTPRPFV